MKEMWKGGKEKKEYQSNSSINLYTFFFQLKGDKSKAPLRQGV